MTNEAKWNMSHDQSISWIAYVGRPYRIIKTSPKTHVIFYYPRMKRIPTFKPYILTGVSLPPSFWRDNLLKLVSGCQQASEEAYSLLGLTFRPLKPWAAYVCVGSHRSCVAVARCTSYRVHTIITMGTVIIVSLSNYHNCDKNLEWSLFSKLSSSQRTQKGKVEGINATCIASPLPTQKKNIF
jgi:hypothetical protein